MTTATTRTVVAHRYRCSTDGSVLCDQGDGRPTRKACRRCGGVLTVETGQWGVFEWTAHGAYQLEAAISTFANRPLADRWAEPRNLVVRFIRDGAT